MLRRKLPEPISRLSEGSLSVARGAVGVRSPCRSVRKCQYGYEFGYYQIEADDSRTFVRLGIARTLDRALMWASLV